MASSSTSTRLNDSHIYEGDGDDLAEQMVEQGNRLVLLPDTSLDERGPDSTERIRIMWGQRLIDDLVTGHYRALVCAVNAEDNSRGIIAQIAEKLPTSQWRERAGDGESSGPRMITEFARHFVQPHNVTVVKFDLDRVKVLGLLRPSQHQHLTPDDLAHGFRIVSAMLRGRPDRLPVASVCFLGARANRLIDKHGHEPSFETVLRTMYESGYRGDVYPAPWMWDASRGPHDKSSGTPRAVFPRYPFPDTFKHMCDGGY